jgi:hypothetical protein
MNQRTHYVRSELVVWFHSHLEYLVVEQRLLVCYWVRYEKEDVSREYDYSKGAKSRS